MRTLFCSLKRVSFVRALGDLDEDRLVLPLIIYLLTCLDLYNLNLGILAVSTPSILRSIIRFPHLQMHWSIMESIIDRTLAVFGRLNRLPI